MIRDLAARLDKIDPDDLAGDPGVEALGSWVAGGAGSPEEAGIRLQRLVGNPVRRRLPGRRVRLAGRLPDPAMDARRPVPPCARNSAAQRHGKGGSNDPAARTPEARDLCRRAPRCCHPRGAPTWRRCFTSAPGPPARYTGTLGFCYEQSGVPPSRTWIEPRPPLAKNGDPIFQPLDFRNLTVKNRIFRSNISGKFDGDDGSLSQTRVNWETLFARGGVGAIISSYVPALIEGRIIAGYATIHDDAFIGGWRVVGGSVHRYGASTFCNSAIPGGRWLCPAFTTSGDAP